MTAYAVANYRVTNPDAYSSYPGRAIPLIHQYGGEVLVGDFNSEAIEGSPHPVTIVVRFPSKEAATAFYNSDEYQGIINLRTDNSEGNFLLCDGADGGD